jgi:hypothetical protein
VESRRARQYRIASHGGFVSSSAQTRSVPTTACTDGADAAVAYRALYRFFVAA